MAHLCTAIPDSFYFAGGRQFEVVEYAGWAAESLRSDTQPDGESLHGKPRKESRSNAKYCDRLICPVHTMQPTCQRYSSS